MDLPRINPQKPINSFRVSLVQTECPKCGIVCGDDTISVTSEQVYDPKEKRWSEVKRTIRATISTTYVKLPADSKCLCSRTDEHLHRKCFVCGFYWSTDTIEDFGSTRAGSIDRAIVENE